MAKDLEPLEPQYAELKWIDGASKLLDNKFRIPGTNIRFGADFIMGLVPGAGDLMSFGVSSTLILAMVRHGASGSVVARMLGNLVLDTVVGSIPVLGNIFDLTYKANRRNVQLLKAHYHEGKHQGSVWPLLIGVLVTLIVIFALMIWVVFEVLSWFFGLLNQMI